MGWLEALAKGKAGPEDGLSLAPAGRTPVRALTFPCWDWPVEILVSLVRGRGRTLVVKDQEAASVLARALRGPGFCHPQLCDPGEVTSPI